MTREIKFKAWDLENKRWMPNVYRFEERTHKGKKTHGVSESWQDDDDGRFYYCELVQFTGLLDKNGKEIYEGDIVKWISVGEEDGNLEDVRVESDMGKHIVVFKEGKFCIEKPDICLGNFIQNEIEVCGNIYENSELLK